MQDTPDHIKKLQLKMWLAKKPEERLLLTLRSSEELLDFWNEGKKSIAAAKLQNKAPELKG